jgi:hypothetical protein
MLQENKASLLLAHPSSAAQCDQPAPAAVLDGACSPAACERFGTAVDFVANPNEAATLAGRDQKLLFVLHLSGNFEDSQFT